jgi:hypothetical protein
MGSEEFEKKGLDTYCSKIIKYLIYLLDKSNKKLNLILFIEKINIIYLYIQVRLIFIYYLKYSDIGLTQLKTFLAGSEYSSLFCCIL